MANLNHSTIFEGVESPGDNTGSAGYAPAYLQVIFAFGGFNQANYVCGSSASHTMIAYNALGIGRDVQASHPFPAYVIHHGIDHLSSVHAGERHVRKCLVSELAIDGVTDNCSLW